MSTDAHDHQSSTAPPVPCPLCDLANQPPLIMFAVGAAIGSAHDVHGLGELCCERHRGAFFQAAMRAAVFVNTIDKFQSAMRSAVFDKLAPVDNSHEAMERRGELHALLEGCLQVEGAVRISKEQMAIHFGARCVELCASHGVDDVAAMLAVIAEERS